MNLGNRVDGAGFIEPKKSNKSGNKLDRIMGELRSQGKTYAEWQKEMYPVRVNRKNHIRDFGRIY